ncbi:MAG: ABC transporter ATP-binding protein [Proteobacteria bacterium]|nr:ABC transporter ATP-binding protein [Pseudomonadota bacterium]
MSAAIVARHLTRRFGDFTAVDDVSFEVAAGEIFGFLGPNGSGKTVTIKMLTGLLPPSAGTAVIDGLDVSHDAEAVRTRIGYMSQKFGLYDDLTALENLRFYGMAYGLRGARLAARIDTALERNGLGPYKDRLAGRLSGGWRQRLALACAMIHEPRILYLDEPTAGIDPVARRQLWDLLFELAAQGITFFVTTHYMDEAERCGHLAYLYYGRLIADGTPDGLARLPEVTPAGTRRYGLTTSDAGQARRIAATLPGVRSSTIFGRGLHVLVDAHVDMQAIVAALTRAGVAVDECRALVPSLEDVFVALTERRQREIEGGP